MLTNDIRRILVPLAVRLGVVESVIVAQIEYHAKKDHDPTDEVSVGMLHRDLPWWSTKTIERAIANLVADGVLIERTHDDKGQPIKRQGQTGRRWQIDYARANLKEAPQNAKPRSIKKPAKVDGFIDTPKMSVQPEQAKPEQSPQNVAPLTPQNVGTSTDKMTVQPSFDLILEREESNREGSASPTTDKMSVQKPKATPSRPDGSISEQWRMFWHLCRNVLFLHINVTPKQDADQYIKEISQLYYAYTKEYQASWQMQDYKKMEAVLRDKAAVSRLCFLGNIAVMPPKGENPKKPAIPPPAHSFTAENAAKRAGKAIQRDPCATPQQSAKN